MDIGSLLSHAGGASAIARELGVDQSTVERGTEALAPHVTNGIQTRGLPGEPESAEPYDQQVIDRGETDTAAPSGGLGGILGGLMGADSGGALGSLVGGGVGNQILGHIFGSKAASRDVATQASQQSGVDTSVLKQLLPIVAGAVAMHYITKGRHGAQSGSGGALGSILGGLGGI